jgi:small subunit ribosomal protein S2
MPTSVTIKQLLEHGVHFGHRSRKWNPKMKEFIFTERSGVHIIDLQKTLANLQEIHDDVRDTVRHRGLVLFVGTKRQAQGTIQVEAERCGMPYINQRWLGGTLTNWKTIRQRIETLKRLESDRDNGAFDHLTKKERLLKQREIDRLLLRLGGIRNMDKLPSLLFVVDVTREYTAVKEANTLGIPIIGIVDTNGDPDSIDHIIPANDDAIRSIQLLTRAVADAVIEGKELRKDSDMEEIEPSDLYRGDMGDDDDDEAYLAPALIARMRDNELRFDDED